MSTIFVRVHAGNTVGPIWTESGIVTGGGDASVQVTVAESGSNGDGAAAPAGAASTRLLPAIKKAHLVGVAGVAADHGLQRIVSVGVNGDMKIWNGETRSCTHVIDTTPADAW